MAWRWMDRPLGSIGIALAISSISTLVAGWLAGTIGPIPTLYVMLGAMALSVALWFWWTGPVRRGEIPAPRSVEGTPPHATPEPPM